MVKIIDNLYQCRHQCRRWGRLLFLVLLLSGLQACSTMRHMYEGEVIGEEQGVVSVIRSSQHPFARLSPRIERIDDFKVRPHTQSVAVLPGEHILIVSMSGGEDLLLTQKVRFTFVTEPGHTYIVDGFLDWENGDQLKAWVIDDETGELVAGSKP